MFDIIVAMGIPTAVFGIIAWAFKRHVDKKDKIREEREKKREDLMLMMMNSNRANTVLCTAIAKAVQRIPDAHCNGDMTRALEVVEKANQEEKDFLINQGVRHIFE
jgi:hypothetical protein